MYVCVPWKFLQTIVGDYFAYLKSGLCKRFRGKCRIHPEYSYLRECVTHSPRAHSNTPQSAKLAMVILNYFYFFLSGFVCRALLQFPVVQAKITMTTARTKQLKQYGTTQNNNDKGDNDRKISVQCVVKVLMCSLPNSFGVK